MQTIHHLSNKIIRQIAAGEVISEPVSVVKEALENSLDAEATHIEIELKDGGSTLIKIADNGIGIGYDDLLIATDRHSTSKIISDLDNIITLGFRGEFLASLISVANVKIVSKLIDNPNAFQAIYKVNNNPEIEPNIRNHGTTLIVEDLFIDVPARRKYLPKKRINISRIKELVYQFTLAYPDKRFVLISDRVELFRSQPGSLIDAITKILGRSTSKNLIKIESKSVDNLWSVNGYISSSIELRSNRSSQFFFLNKRIIKNETIEKALEDGFTHYLATNKFPIAILNFKTNPSEFDPNVHPSKKEIRLKDKNSVYRFVKETININLVQTSQISGHNTNKISSLFQSQIDNVISNRSKFKDENLETEIPQIVDDFNVEEVEGESTEEDLSLLNKINALDNISGSNLNDKTFKHVTSKEDIKDIQPIFQFNKKYILCVSSGIHDDLFLIDQHAVAERITLENLLKKQTKAIIKQKTLENIFMNLNPEQFEIIFQNVNTINKYGYNIILTENEQIEITAYPKFYGKKLNKNQIIYNLRQIIDDLRHNNSESLEKSQIEIEIAKSVACRNSIKGGQILSQEEMKNLISDMRRAKFPWVCCHGRPSIFKLSYKSLNKLFWRE